MHDSLTCFTRESASATLVLSFIAETCIVTHMFSSQSGCLAGGSHTLLAARPVKLHCIRRRCTAKVALTKRASVPCVANKYWIQPTISSQLSSTAARHSECCLADHACFTRCHPIDLAVSDKSQQFHLPCSLGQHEGNTASLHRNSA